MGEKEVTGLNNTSSRILAEAAPRSSSKNAFGAGEALCPEGPSTNNAGMHTYIQTKIHTCHYMRLDVPFHFPFHYNTFHCIALHCITLHYITLHYISLRYITLHYITLHYTTLQYIPFRSVPFHSIPFHTCMQTCIHLHMHA